MEAAANAILPAKPLGRKAYGSIPHLRGSRVGPGDWFLEDQQAAHMVVSARRTQRHVDRVLVTEKLDGSCCALARIGDRVVALNRAGYACDTSPYETHRGFARWVAARADRFLAALGDLERVPGEWMQVAHGTLYDIRDDEDLFVPFDVIVPGADRGLPERRLPHDEQRERFARLGLTGAKVLSDGPAVALDDALALLGEFGHHGATETAEGVVYRLETNGTFNYLAKFVRPGKVDGKYLKGLSSNDVTEDVHNGPAAARWAA